MIFSIVDRIKLKIKYKYANNLIILIKMKNEKKILIYIFLFLLYINYALTQTLNLEKTSSLECEPSLGTYKFNFQAKNVTKDLQGAAFNINFEDSEMIPYSAICSLEDEEELKKAATTTNEIEDISYTCRFVAMELITEPKSLLSGVVFRARCIT